MFDRMRVSGLVGAAILTVACGGGTEQATPGDPAPINEIRSKYEAAFSAGDAAGLVALFTDDAVSLPDHHVVLEGKAAIQQYFQELFTQFSATMTVMPADTELAGNFAHEHGAYTIKVTPKAGGGTVTDDGKYLVVFKRGADGVWKIHHDMDNSNRMPPMPGAPAASDQK